MRRVLFAAVLSFVTLAVASAPSQATSYTGDCFRCNGPSTFSGSRCAVAPNNDSGSGITCMDQCFVDRFNGESQCVCSTDGNACYRITVTAGGGGGGGSTCVRDPMTGVCPASCFSCGGGSGGGAPRV